MMLLLLLGRFGVNWSEPPETGYFRLGRFGMVRAGHEPIEEAQVFFQSSIHSLLLRVNIPNIIPIIFIQLIDALVISQFVKVAGLKPFFSLLGIRI